MGTIKAGHRARATCRKGVFCHSMTEFQEDYYAILGVEESAAPEDIRKAYLKLAKKLHPDRFPHDEEAKAQAQAEFRLVTQAHYVLGDQSRKEEYDNIRQLAKARKNLATGEPKDGKGETEAEKAASEGEIHLKWAAKHLERADDLFRKRRYQEAETAIKEAIRLVPDEPAYHTKLAEIYIARNWLTYARTEVETALRKDPRNAEARSLEARIKAMAREKHGKSGKKGLFQQLKDLLTRKL